MQDFLTAYEGGEPFVFISYAHKDTDIVLPVVLGLHNRGVRVWYDGGLEVGAEWADNIAEHLERCACVIAFVSRNYGDSHNCRREVDFAINLRKDPIVIYLDANEKLPAGLRMQLGSLHAMFYDRYPDADALADVLTKAEIVKPCVSETRVEEPIEAISVTYDTIDFAEETKRSTVTIDSKADIAFTEDEMTQDALLKQGINALILKDYKVAVELFYLAAEQGCAEGQFRLGNCYRFGYGVAKSEREAYHWYQKAAQQGYTEAQCSVADCYVFGIGVTKSLTEAWKWYHAAAEKGHKDACWWLANFYEKGWGVEKNLKLAIEWYRKAKENGCRGVDKDIRRCRAALKK